MLSHRSVVAVAFLAPWIAGVLAEAAAPGDPPAAPREFRAAWVATVANIDWPSRPGLPAGDQRREMSKILDKAVELKLNAIILHVRPGADALYQSAIEPWSEYLSGQMGQGPVPEYDPLEFAVQQAHRRGLQLHAWFNPYRARHADAKTPAASNHVSLAHPEIVRQYGNFLWLDPGEPAAEEQFIAVVRDVVKRYDVDGIHIDDYFYPYPVNDDAGKRVPFPDDDSYARAAAAGNKLPRDDWRRQNVDRLVERMYAETKKVKPWVLVGVSPFGIWRPGNPQGVVGFDPYTSLYADARKWLREGWVDYWTPQLYWKVDSQGQPYGKLLAWWQGENVKQRHLWPGNYTSQVKELPAGKTPTDKDWTAKEIVRQIAVTRRTRGATGNVHFSYQALAGDWGGVAEALEQGPYKEAALIPETTWLGGEPAERPKIVPTAFDNRVHVALSLPSEKRPWQWVVRLRTDRGWRTAIVPGRRSTYSFPLEQGRKPLEVAASAVTRLGAEGAVVRAKVAAVAPAAVGK